MRVGASLTSIPEKEATSALTVTFEEVTVSSTGIDHVGGFIYQRYSRLRHDQV